MSGVPSNLEKLTEKIINADVDISKVKHPWGGADVIIAPSITKELKEWLEDQPIVISNQKTIPKRRLVITEYWKELSWLFDQAKVILADQIEYITKYDFYGGMADASIRFIENHEEYEAEELLLAALWEVRRYYHE